MSWRNTILDHFAPNVSKLTLVADPDALLTEERLTVELRPRGFDLIEFADPVEFRYAYESQYRSVWDRGEHTDLVVVLRLRDAAFEALPYDLLRAGRRLAFDLGMLFPNLSYPVVQMLDASLLDALFDAQKRASPDRMGDNATKDFILRHVFGIAAELIANEVDLLRTLLRLHYKNVRLPHILSERLVQVLKSQGAFCDWPLDAVVPNDAAFFAFLQERWPSFLRNLGHARLREEGVEYGLAYSGPDHLPFDHNDIHIYIDNLFIEGKLVPVCIQEATAHVEPWMRSGMIEDGPGNEGLRITRLFDLVDGDRPTEESRHTDWIGFARAWAELAALIHSGADGMDKARFRQIGEEVNAAFSRWLDGHYASLINLPPNNPVMLHHVARHLAREMEGVEEKRTALIVVDGLALDQWITIRQSIQKQDRALLMRESAVFAWIPTLTSVSRQSIFAGRPPLYFPASINSTSGEVNHWRKFWEDAGLSRLEIAYQRGLGDLSDGDDIIDALNAVLPLPKTKVVGLVVDKVDKIMHGMQLGAAGMHNQIKQWCQSGYLSALIGGLLDRGYDVWLTSDHGNIECRGRGRPSEGVIAETRGERVRVYPTPELRNQTATGFAFAHKWQPVGLPPDYFPLVAGGGDAFITPGETIVGHGGNAIEEVIVPLVKFERLAV